MEDRQPLRLFNFAGSAERVTAPVRGLRHDSQMGWFFTKPRCQKATHLERLRARNRVSGRSQRCFASVPTPPPRRRPPAAGFFSYALQR